MNRIGIDVGGTNTDAVLLDGPRIAGWVKTATTADTTGGIITALHQLLAQTGIEPDAVAAVMVGTTHFTNAVVQRRDLTPVAAVRIGLPASASLPPFCDWPDDLAELCRGGVYMVRGGHEYDGRPIVPFDRTGMAEAAARIRDAGITAAAVSSVFSPLTAECEEQAAEILRQAVPGLRLTLSHSLGRIGLLERENVALLNASLADLAERTVGAFTAALAQSGLPSRLFLTQNDGTVMQAEVAQAYPVYSFASGPTNSMRGAAYLSGLEDAIVADVGGTTTDIGVLRHGFPREANSVIEIGGVRTLFRMPDLISLGLGGGSLVQPEPLQIGPQSTGYDLTRQARVFGGEHLTATDLAAARHIVDLGDASLVTDLSPALLDTAFARIETMLAEGVDRIKTEAGDRPLIAVGGGAFLVPERLPGISEVVHLPDGAVANAVGAAIAQVSGEVDRIFQGLEREAAIAAARNLAEARAVEFGARADSLRVVDVEDLPIAYLPGNALRTRVRVVGDIG